MSRMGGIGRHIFQTVELTAKYHMPTLGRIDIDANFNFSDTRYGFRKPLNGLLKLLHDFVQSLLRQFGFQLKHYKMFYH